MKLILALAVISAAVALIVGGACVYMRLRLGFWPWEDWR